jgi:hypothetical protein
MREVKSYIGGISKAAAHGAIAVLAGLLLSTVSAQAADLGGNCCADLEERVAELEATTARKGNRRMSLTVSGQVSRSILYWNDGDDSGTYAGLDNHIQSTRFTFSGTAKIRTDLTAGFEFMTEIGFGARTSGVDQGSPDGSTTLVPGANGTTAWSADSLLAVRTANWWLEDKRWGRATVGRLNVGGPVGTIDLGGISTVATASPNLAGGSFMFKTEGGAFSNVRMATLVGPTYGGDRIEGVRYDSPTIGGFVAQATWGEDEVWSASLRYAGEFSGFRVAAGIGYQEQDVGQLDGAFALSAGPNTPIQNTSQATRDRSENEWSASLALMHVASGLFAQGHYAESEFFNGADATSWMIQGGITKNWFGMGNTSFYGEYGRGEDFSKAAVAGSSSEISFIGLGVVQQIDAAAMEVFLGWRRFSGERSGTLPAEVLVGGVSTQLTTNGDYEDIDLIHGGARIRF